MEWQPIETAPDDVLVVVGWVDADDGDARHDFDYREDGCWMRHEDNVQFADACAPAGSRMPAQDAPYTHWLPLPAFPSNEQGNGPLREASGQNDDGSQRSR